MVLDARQDILSSDDSTKGEDLRLGIACGVDHVAMIDTGAQVSLLDHDIFLYLQRTTRQVMSLLPSRVKPHSVTGNPLPVVGEVRMSIPGLPVAQYIVVRDLPCNVLLGADFCSENGILLDFIKSRVQINGRWIKAVKYRTKKLNVFIVDNLNYSHLVNIYPKVLAANEDTLGVAKGVQMSITTRGPPIRQRPYRIPIVKREVVGKEITRLLKQGIIRPSFSEWASPIVVVPKKNGKYRLCVDYRKLNAVTVKDSHPLPNIRDIFDTLKGASIFSLIDLRQGYHQVKLAKEDCEKTAFTCHFGLFEYTRIPFGLTNAPSVFQRYMNVVLSGLIGVACMVYLDDIVIFGADKEQHDKHLRLVLDRLQKYRLTTQASKCTFGAKSIKLLGHIIDGDGIHMDPAKGEAIRDAPPPTDPSGIKRFLGATGYYRDLIPGFARMAAPLTNLTKKSVEWKWTADCQKAFENLKKAMLSDNCVAFPDVNKPYNLFTDACDYAMGAVLTQTDPKTGKEKAIYYISHQFSEVQQRWATIEKEAYALIYALGKLRPYILGSPGITAYTDHKPLLCLFTSQLRNTKIQRWSIMLSEFNVKVKYIKGEKNIKADFLSRLRHDKPSDDLGINVIDAILGHHYPTAGVVEQLEALEVLRHDNIPIDELRYYQKHLSKDDTNNPDLISVDGVLCSIRPPTQKAEPRPRIVLPEPYRKRIVEQAHEETAHAATARTLDHLREAYVWYGMTRDVVQHISTCATCQSHSK